MLSASCDAVPVVDEDGQSIGMITAADVLTAVAGRIAADRGPGELRTALFHIEPVVLSPQDS
ncbi:CBS domain-containing protein [Planobispora longispora]|uniref:CBS domain-containing protein n=1 Tax=Planobispora longispora TaxID=28887 RepID=A0A8J3W695_9ACTN|nr:CBS domain-containing protein [Planobispora longispora]GIH78259.1 hypothetical protein Plo01_46880 [Planobispora longispora]